MSDIQRLAAGDKAPDFCVHDQDEKETCLKDFKGKWLVLYFYPKDNTPGCTVEANDFTRFQSDLEAKNTVVLGASPDSCKSHRGFIEKQSLNIGLLSDPDHQLMEKYAVWGLKKNYGREYYGVIRSTFIINPEGNIAGAFYNVKAKGHAEKIVQKITELQG
ncbi:MAG: thioredoxin-dependent thiol peroxidase [bacterium]|nr:thioredoxin-dependent thiol peroxidase [bacterium]